MTRARITLKPAAAEIFRSPAKNKIVLSGRRFGKTMLLLAICMQKALSKPGAQIHYMAPSRKMARDIAWRTLKQQCPPNWTRNVYESTLSIEFNNGSLIRLGGLDYADSTRGQTSDLICLDEFCYASRLKESYQAALLPMLATTDGETIFASTPAGGGNFAQELWEQAATADNWERWNYPSVAGGWISPEWIERQRKLLDPVLFRQEFWGTWEQLVGAVFGTFSDKNISKQVDMGGSILVGLDFNVSPLTAVICQVQGSNIAVLDELVLYDSDTRAMCQALRTRFPTREVIVCPDPTGSRRQTQGVGLSDHGILKKMGGFKLATPNAPWRVRDKINAIRLLIQSADGERRLQIDPRCKTLIRALRSIEFEPGRPHYDKRSQWGHVIDALGYMALATTKGLLPYRLGLSDFKITS